MDARNPLKHFSLEFIRLEQGRAKARVVFARGGGCAPAREAFGFRSPSQSTQQNISAASHKVPIMDRRLSKKGHHLRDSLFLCKHIDGPLSRFARKILLQGGQAYIHGTHFRKRKKPQRCGQEPAQAKIKCLKLDSPSPYLVTGNKRYNSSKVLSSQSSFQSQLWVLLAWET